MNGWMIQNSLNIAQMFTSWRSWKLWADFCPPKTTKKLKRSPGAKTRTNTGYFADCFWQQHRHSRESLSWSRSENRFWQVKFWMDLSRVLGRISQTFLVSKHLQCLTLSLTHTFVKFQRVFCKKWSWKVSQNQRAHVRPRLKRANNERGCQLFWQSRVNANLPQHHDNTTKQTRADKVPSILWFWVGSDRLKLTHCKSDCWQTKTSTTPCAFFPGDFYAACKWRFLRVTSSPIRSFSRDASQLSYW